MMNKFFFQAEDGIREFCLSRGLGDGYKGQDHEGGGRIVKVGADAEDDHDWPRASSSVRGGSGAACQPVAGRRSETR